MAEFDPKRMAVDRSSGAIIIRPTNEEKEIMRLRKANQDLASKIDKILDALPQLKEVL